MDRTKSFAQNIIILTGSSLVMRSIGMAYQVWLVGRIGAGGIGLYQLAMSVSVLLGTLAVSGIRFAATRLVSEEMGLGREGAVAHAMRRCMVYSLCFGSVASALMFALAEPVGFLWVGDARTLRPLRLMALSLPFVSLSAVLGGYFTACGRVYKSAAVQLCEQLARIALVVLMLGSVKQGDIERSCSAVALAGTAAEVFSFLLLGGVYILDRRAHGEKGAASPKLTLRMLNIALPLAFSAYARSALSTLQHLLVPRGLRKNGLTADQALAGYGTIQGMVFPLIGFPSAFLLAVAELLVPELTRAQVSGRYEQISLMSRRLVRLGLVFSAGAAAALFAYADELADAVYRSAEAGRYIRVFALLAPVMYMDMITDGMLKGLGQHIYSMGVNIIDAAVSVLLVWTVLPRYSLSGYIAVICVTECMNAALSVARMLKVTRLRPRASWVFKPALCAAGAALLSRAVMGPVAGRCATAAAVGLMLLIYAGLVYLTVPAGELGLRGIFKKGKSVQ